MKLGTWMWLLNYIEQRKFEKRYNQSHALDN